MTTSVLGVTLWVPAMIIFGLVVLGAIAYWSITGMREEKRQADQEKKRHDR